MTITPTQADRELFIEIADKADHDEEILAGYHFTWEVEQLARYRIAAEERGARWAIEAGAAAPQRVRNLYGLDAISCGYCEAEIRALDPKTICDRARETDRDPT
jgi:hypothetical protein